MNALSNWFTANEVAVSQAQMDALESLCEEHLKWNRVFNLSAHRTRDSVIEKQLIDSLMPLDAITRSSVLDIGTGPGFPSLPLAVMCPESHFYLLDSNAKKLAFATHIAGLLKLTNVTIVHQRIENYVPNEPHDQIISRAFSSLDDMIRCASPRLKPEGQILAMKGPAASDELNDAKLKYPGCNFEIKQLNPEKTRFLVTVTRAQT